MKKFLCFLLLAISILSYAQLDREHWFAPMFDGQSNGTPQQYLHLSTNESTPFNVTIYNNNIVINQVTISKGNPAIIPILRSYIITDDPNDLHKVGTMGLYVKADKPCFANLRFRVTNHAEIITSKGTAGIGTKFYTVVAPNLQNNANLGFSASFLATEDQTVVTVDKFKKNLYFNNYGNATSFTFTLNKGQSFMIDGRSITAGNMNGFTGATVTADKPISMSNGNFNGQYATTDNQNGSDILMDQSVPVDKLGDDFVIVKGYGEIGNNMEGAIVVATKKNTSVYLNDATLPIVTLANEGDSYRITEDQYINRGNKHYNLHIKSDKNIYVYQLLGGVENGTTPLATGGMNYIPPLNCYLPKKIDELSYISRMALTDSDYTFLTKLNIITEKGATVKVNGQTPDPMNGPYDISSIEANQKWVTYSIPGVTGNVTVESSKAVTAGIASGNAAFGYGGYFAGFSSIPLILKISGECIPGVTLSVTDGFIKYQWLLKSGNSYIPIAGANLNTFNPTQAGIYAVKMQQGSCPEIQTQDYKFFNCTSFTNSDYDICNSQVITPAFALSTQTVNTATIKITTPPTKGTVVIGSNGLITYTANPNSSGKDYFMYTFCGNDALPDCENAQVTVNIRKIKYANATLAECSSKGTASFNLANANITNDTNITRTYFSDAALTTQIQAAQLSNYVSSAGTVYVVLKNSVGCTETATITLKIVSPPVVTPSLYTRIHCDEDLDSIIDGIYKANLATVTPIVVQNPENFTVRYYTDEGKALTGANNNISGTFNFSNMTSVWIRVDSPEICAPVIKEIQLNTGTKIPLIKTDAIVEICDANNDLSEPLNLADYISEFTSNSGSAVSFFKTSKDAFQNTNSVSANQTISGDSKFYMRVTSNNFCTALATLTIKFKYAKVSKTLPESASVCLGSRITLDAGAGFESYLWSNGSTTQSVTVAVGDYWVDLKSDNGCVYRQSVSVKNVVLPEIRSVDIQGSTVTVFAEGGTPPYRYSLDGRTYQDSNTFTNVGGGKHTISVISAENCAPVYALIDVILQYNVITPNGDGINDVFDYSSLMKKDEPMLQIFDRYGKLIFSGDYTNRFIWDGKLTGKTVSTGSYWYIMRWKEPGSNRLTQYNNWILVKNRE